MDMKQKRAGANGWISGFLKTLVEQYGTDGVMLESGILYVEVTPGIWVDFTRPEFNENLSLVGAAGLVRRNREGVK